MALLNGLNISATALTAQRFRMDVISENLANAEVTRTADGTPYRRRNVVLGSRESSVSFSDTLNNTRAKLNGGGVRVAAVTESQEPFKLVYDPDHPDANDEGYVNMPNVNTVTEMVDLMAASRSYEANITAFNTTKSIALKALEIGK